MSDRLRPDLAGYLQQSLQRGHCVFILSACPSVSVPTSQAIHSRACSGGIVFLPCPLVRPSPSRPRKLFTAEPAAGALCFHLDRLSVRLCLDICSVPTSTRAQEPRWRALSAGQSIPVPTWRASPCPCNNGILSRTGKSIIQMLLRGHQMTAAGYLPRATKWAVTGNFYSR